MTPEAARDRIALKAEVLKEYVPPEHGEALLKDVQDAVTLYFEPPRPADVARELKELEQHLRHPTARTAQVVADLSPATKDVLRTHNIAVNPEPFANLATLRAAADELRQALLVAGYWKQEKDQRRWVQRVLGAVRVGRPASEREAVLISQLALVYARHTGHVPTRPWSIEARSRAGTDFELFVLDVLDALRMSARLSAKKLIRRHIAARNKANDSREA